MPPLDVIRQSEKKWPSMKRTTATDRVCDARHAASRRRHVPTGVSHERGVAYRNCRSDGDPPGRRGEGRAGLTRRLDLRRSSSPHAPALPRVLRGAQRNARPRSGLLCRRSDVTCRRRRRAPPPPGAGSLEARTVTNSRQVAFVISFIFSPLL